MDAPLMLVLVKVSLLLCAALAGARLLRRAPALSRHGLWSGVFLAVLVLPVLAVLLPPLPVPVPWNASADRLPVEIPALAPASSQEVTARVPERAVVSGDAELFTTGSPEVASPRATVAWSAASLLAATWAIGAVLAASVILLSLFRVRRLAVAAAPLDDVEWNETVRQIAGRLGMRRTPRVLISEQVGTPMAGGIVRPTIFVPSGAREWDADCRSVVLAHELAHLSRQDPLRQLVARLAVAVYWFHPLAWLAAREATAAREQACDEAVIALGTRPSTYARVLMDFADAMPAAAPALAALPMIQRSLLEKRLMAILTDDTRPRARRLALVPVLTVAVFTISVAAVQLEPRALEPGQVSVNVTGGAPGGVVGGVPGGITGSVAIGVQGGVPAGVSGGVSAGVPGGVPAGVAAGVPGGVANGVPAGVAITVTQTLDSACAFDTSGSFSGSSSSSRRADGSVAVYDMVGVRNSDLVFLKHFGDLRVCALFSGIGAERDRNMREWTRANRILLETVQGSQTRRMEMSSGSRIVSWQVNGVDRPADAGAKEWADRLIALLEPSWELSSLRGQVSSKRGQISSIQGQRSSLQGEISSIQGEVSSLQGKISSLRGEHSSLQGRISAIQGHVSSLQGAISSEQGAISSLQASRWDSDAARRGNIADRIREHEKNIARIQAEIRAYNAPARIAEVEKEILKLRVDDRIAEVDINAKSQHAQARIQEVRKRIDALEVEKRIDRIEQEIVDMNVDRRSRDLEAQMEAALKRLEETLARIR